MCGIAGIYKGQSSQDVELMLEKIIHRGSAGQGVKNCPQVHYTRTKWRITI